MTERYVGNSKILRALRLDSIWTQCNLPTVKGTIMFVRRGSCIGEGYTNLQIKAGSANELDGSLQTLCPVTVESACHGGSLRVSTSALCSDLCPSLSIINQMTM